MLRVKTSEAIDVVCMSDPALHEVQLDKMSLYELSRNLEDLGDLSKLDEKPTVWRLKPIPQRLENFIDQPSSDDMWFIFSRCASTTSQLDSADGPVQVPMEEVNGELVVSGDARDIIPREHVHELAAVAIQRCNGMNGIDIPFAPIMPGSWRPGRILYQRHRAQREAMARLAANGSETASETDTASG